MQIMSKLDDWKCTLTNSLIDTGCTLTGAIDMDTVMLRYSN